MSDMVGNPEDSFFRDAAQFNVTTVRSILCSVVLHANIMREYVMKDCTIDEWSLDEYGQATDKCG